tara:strand:+ start:345 stop:590 length:246 start_codon:yes stop_codon:yes gene_type:complete
MKRKDGTAMNAMRNRYRSLPANQKERAQVLTFGMFISACSIMSILAGFEGGADVGKIAGSILGVDIGYMIADRTRQFFEKF